MLALAGIGVAGYLTMTHLNYLQMSCGKSSGCEEVAQHYSAHGFGIPALRSIPTAAFGLAMYLGMAALCFVRAMAGSERAARAAGLVQWGMALGGVLVAGWLTYMEAFVIHAWCRWCVASAIIILLALVVSTIEQRSKGSWCILVSVGDDATADGANGAEV